MKVRSVTFLTLALIIVSALVGWSLLATPASGSGPMRQDATSQQQTIDAVVNGYFTQTAQAQQQIGVTQTIQAAFDQALTATAGFDATVQAQFGALQTATAAAIPTPTVAAETLQAAEVIELPLQLSGPTALVAPTWPPMGTGSPIFEFGVMSCVSWTLQAVADRRPERRQCRDALRERARWHDRPP